nr:hypothetical protein [Kofleriaceae bacterium]
MTQLVAALAIASGCGGGNNSNADPLGVAGGSNRAGDDVAGSGSDGSAMPDVGSVDTVNSGSGSGSGIIVHGEKWNNVAEVDGSTSGAQAFKGYKETWVYVDGEPKGVLTFAEIPSWQPVAWADDIEGLDFGPNTPIDKRNKRVQLMRYGLIDYLKIIGVDVSKIKGIYVQASGYTYFTKEILDKWGKDIAFDFTGNDMTKTRFYWPKGVPVNMGYDRYVALTVIVNKPLLQLDEHRRIVIDGQIVNGIPYHGTPERGGVRVYLDGKLAMVIKRNQLNDVGRVSPNEPRWSLIKLLAANGVKADIGGIDVVSEKDVFNMHRTRMSAESLKDPTFATSSQASGEVVFGTANTPVNAFLLYSKGHVPPVKPLPPLERDWQTGP